MKYLLSGNEWGPAWMRRTCAYLSSVLAVVAAVILTQMSAALHSHPTDLFFAAVAATAWLGGRGPAIVATILSTLAVDYFITPPLYSILLDLDDFIRLAAFAFVAFLICYLQEGYQRIATRLRDANNVLEQRVDERTADLAAANEFLRAEVNERQRAESALKLSEESLRVALGQTESSLQEKVVLIREINHRVKNNLQIITSLLSLQGSRIEDHSCQELFKECQQRVRAIALVHQRLCCASNFATIDLGVYLRQLVQDLFRSYFAGPGTVTPRVLVDDTELDIDQLIPCALIVNELVCNAFKYAFPDGRSGEVRVEVHRQSGEVSLTVADDGIGFSPSTAVRPNGVGLQIVQALVDQVSGQLHWENGRGTSAVVTFPVNDLGGEHSHDHVDSANSGR